MRLAPSHSGLGRAPLNACGSRARRGCRLRPGDASLSKGFRYPLPWRQMSWLSRNRYKDDLGCSGLCCGQWRRAGVRAGGGQRPGFGAVQRLRSAPRCLPRRVPGPAAPGRARGGITGLWVAPEARTLVAAAPAPSPAPRHLGAGSGGWESPSVLAQGPSCLSKRAP